MPGVLVSVRWSFLSPVFQVLYFVKQGSVAFLFPVQSFFLKVVVPPLVLIEDFDWYEQIRLQKILTGLKEVIQNLDNSKRGPIQENPIILMRLCQSSRANIISQCLSISVRPASFGYAPSG